jgi:micrococcal nuclease
VSGRPIKLALAPLIALGIGYGAWQEAKPSAPSSQAATIARVTDGDTIHVRVGGEDKTVRLIGIDTPETHKPGVPVECGGREASASMARLAPVGARATVTYDPTQDRTDRYGRLLAYVSVNRRSLQVEQLRAGWASVYVYGHRDFERVDGFRRASAVAERGRRGVWGECSGDFHSEQAP